MTTSVRSWRANTSVQKRTAGATPAGTGNRSDAPAVPLTSNATSTAALAAPPPLHQPPRPWRTRCAMNPPGNRSSEGFLGRSGPVRNPETEISLTPFGPPSYKAAPRTDLATASVGGGFDDDSCPAAPRVGV